MTAPALPAGPGLPPGLADAPGQPGPVFAEPWQAQAFAITLQLHQRGLFTWPEWAQALADQIRQAQRDGDADRGDTYYRHWLAALEGLVARKGAASPAALQQHAQAWRQAAARTPHGQPIALQGADFAPAGQAHAHD